MRVVTVKMMRELDRITIEERGVEGMTLMERAGAGVARTAIEILEEIDGKRVLVLTGPGNNGGDGWIAARLLAGEGFGVDVAAPIDPEKLTGNAKTAFERARNENVKYKIFPDGKIDFSKCDLIIDGLLGTGAKGAPRGAIGEMVLRAMASGLPALAIDNPTGVDADTGEVLGNAIPAVATATFGLPKLGQFRYPGKSYVGRLLVVDIGIPTDVIENLPDPDWRAETTEKLNSLLPFRPPDGHKGTFGKAAIIAGSLGMSGAATMAAESCLRSGAGLVEMIVPKGLVGTVENIFREAVTRPVQQVDKYRCLSARALGDILRLAENADAVALGPGIGTHRETVDLIGRLLPKLGTPTVIDADGLNCIARLRAREIPIEFGNKVVITPHPGELSRLLNIEVEEICNNRFEDMHKWVSELGVDVLVLKGASTTIAGAEGPVYINKTGNNGMATGGSGDVLTGIIASLLAQKLVPIDAARLGVYLHGLAGDLASAELGQRSVIAGDILDSLPEAILDLELYSQIMS